MSTLSKRKLANIDHVKGLAKKMAHELKSDIDIIETSKNCFDLMESRKNKGRKIETIPYVAINEVANGEVRDDTSPDILQDSGNEPVQSDAKAKPEKKTKTNKKSSNRKPLVSDS